MKLPVIPAEIWCNIFTLACTDDGYTGRSLSLVSTRFHDISAPFKYQSLVITHWSQIVAFSKIFCQLPDSQRKIKYLFVHHPYLLLDADGYPSLTDAGRIREEDQDDQSEEEWTDDKLEQSDSELDDDDDDDDFEGSLDSEEERELLEDVAYLEVVRDELLPLDGNTRDDVSRDAEIQALFDNILQAFRAILNETSSTLTILAVYWTSFKPLQIQELLPPLPRLEELHINRRSSASRDTREEPPTTVLFPRLRFLYISGDNPRKLSFSDDLTSIAPKLTHIRFSVNHLYNRPRAPQILKHNFNFHQGRMIIEGTSPSEEDCESVEEWITTAFGNFRKSTEFEIGHMFNYDCPKIWQKWWASRIVGDDGPWASAIWFSEAGIRERDSGIGHRVIHPSYISKTKQSMTPSVLAGYRF